MGLLRRPLSIRAGVVLQLALVATASLTLLAVFALKVIEVTMQRRHVAVSYTHLTLPTNREV